MNVFTYKDLKEEIEELSKKSFKIFDRFVPIIQDDNLEANIVVIEAIKGELVDIENKLAELAERCKSGFYFGLKIHLGLNVNNSQKLRFKWEKDIKFPEKNMYDYYKLLNEKGYVLGKSKSARPIGYYGLYEPIEKEKPNKFLEDLVDKDLTPENANERQYEWIKDTIYDREAPIDAIGDLIHLVKDKGYKLGMPAGDERYYDGLYAPISEVRIDFTSKKNGMQLKEFLQEILDHIGLGKIQNVQSFKGYWFVRTNRGEFIINESSEENKIREKFSRIEIILLPDYKGELTVKEIHKQDKYYSIYKIE